MRLIDEIEAAAKAVQECDAPTNHYTAEQWSDMVLLWRLVASPLWPRIKAALEAGEEMRRLLWEARAPQTTSPEMWLSQRTMADNRFRAAAGEGS